MSSQAPRSGGRRGSKKPVPEDSYPHIPEPKQGHVGHLLAFISVLAVLGFGFWTAAGTLLSSPERVSPKALPTTSATQVATTQPASAATQSVAAAAATPAGTPARAASATPGGARVHVVGEGDTLYRIAQRYGTTVEAIMAANGFTDRSKILHIGDRLTIP